MRVTVGEREKLRDILRAMALDADCVDREVAGPLREAESRVAGGGSMPGLIQCAYWRARACVRRDVDTIVIALCDNPAIPHDLFCELDSRFGGVGSDLPELGACNPRYANEIARELILNRPEGFSDAHDVPHLILDGVYCGAVTDEEVLAYLCEPREWSTGYAGEPGYAGGSRSEWTKSDARKLRERLGR